MTFTTIIPKLNDGRQRFIMPNGKGRYQAMRASRYPISVDHSAKENLLNSDAERIFSKAIEGAESFFYGYCGDFTAKAKSADINLSDYGITVNLDNNDRKIGYVTISDCCRIPFNTGQQSKKLSVRQNGVINYMLIARNLKRWGLTSCSKVIFQDAREMRICSWLVHRLSYEESVTLNETLEVNYLTNPDHWTRGCEASTFPHIPSILRHLKSYSIMSGTGMNAETQFITRVGPPESEDPNKEATGITNYIDYESESGKIVSIPFSSPLPRKIYDKSDMDELRQSNNKFDSVMNHLESVYREELPFFFLSRDCPQEHLEEEVNKTCDSLLCAVNRLVPEMWMGLHCDRPVRSPALTTGRTNHVRDDRNKTWRKIGKGGHLFLADSMICLDYHPQDIVIFDGNMLHGVTEMTGKRLQDLSRFSLVLFSRYNCNMKIPDYGNYNQSFDCIRKSKRLRQTM